jgi:beta propeller repeat protein
MKHRKYPRAAALFVAALISSVLISAAGAAWWSPVQRLTDNAVNDYSPQVSGDKVVWHGYDGNDWEIFYYDGSTVIQLTDNESSDVFPQISGDKVVWAGSDGADDEIFLYDGSTVTQLTDNAHEDGHPRISGDKVAWHGWDGNDYEIFYYDGTTVTQLTDNGFNDEYPEISGGNVVWTGYDGWPQIFIYDGAAVTQLTDNDYQDYYPMVSGNNVVWTAESAANGTAEIFLYDGSAIAQLTDNSYNDYDPWISGDKVVWAGRSGPEGTQEIFLYDGSTVTQLTDNDFEDYDPRIFGRNVVWSGNSGPGGTAEIFHYEGSTVTQLTDNGFDDTQPQISGPRAVWVGYAGPLSTGEIFTAVADQQGPTGSIIINQAPYTKSGSVTLNLSAADTGGSGVTQMRFSNDGVFDDTAGAEKWRPYGTTQSWTLSSGDGAKQVRAQFRDAAGNPSLKYSAATFLDTVKPSATPSAPAISTNVSKTLSFKVSWSGSDPLPQSGIAAYDVEYKVGPNGTWTNWKSNTTAKSADFKLAKAGNTYYFRAKSKDNAGNESVWSTIKKTIVPYDNNSLIASRSGFGSTAKSLSSGFYLGTTRYSTKKGDKITYRFTGKSVALIGPKASSRSKAKIYINGNYVKTIDAYSSTLKHRQVLFSKTWSSSGTRTITIENLGTAGRTRFDVDGLGVGR